MKLNQVFALSNTFLLTSGLAFAFQQLDGPNGRIVGGTPTAAGSYPAYGYFTGSTSCGGALIAPNKYLTAAHCFVEEGPPPFIPTTNLGGACFGGIKADCSDAIDFASFVSIAFPDGYNVTESLVNDIAVVTLDKEITSITPYKWNNDPTIPADNSTINSAGYGYTTNTGPLSSVQLEVSLSVVAPDTCAAAYDFWFSPQDRLLFPADLKEEKICAAAPGKDTCAGDSGSPIFQDGVVLGVVSGGNGCADPDLAGFYSRTSFHGAFIAANAPSSESVEAPVAAPVPAPVAAPVPPPVAAPTDDGDDEPCGIFECPLRVFGRSITQLWRAITSLFGF